MSSSMPFQVKDVCSICPFASGACYHRYDYLSRDRFGDLPGVRSRITFWHHPKESTAKWTGALHCEVDAKLLERYRIADIIPHI